MPYTFTLTTTIPASAQDIYDTWLDSIGHSEMTGGAATMSDETGAEVSAWDGYISGRNLELVPGERIVQSWRTTKFTDDHDDSIITVTLEEIDGETLLTLVHSNVPDGQTSYERGGWQSHYFEPMIAYFAKVNLDGEAAKAPKSKRTRATIKTKSKRAASKQKAGPSQQKPKRAAAKARPKRAKKIKTKTKTRAKTKIKPKAKAKRRPSRAHRGR